MSEDKKQTDDGIRVTNPVGKRPEFKVEVLVGGVVVFMDTLDARKEERRKKILDRIEGKFPAFAEHRQHMERELIASASSWDPDEQVEEPVKDPPPRLFDEVEPHPDPVDGAALVSDLADAVRRYVVVPDGAAETVALWIVHTYALDAFDFTPRLTVSSPVKRCGKTTLLDTVRGACARSVPTVNLTTASLFRLIAKHRPTLIIDEADNLIVGRDADQEMRGILCSGYRRGEFVVRTVGDDHEPEAFDVHAPVAFGLIGTLPDTLNDRSIVIEMRRKHPGEVVERARPSELVTRFQAFRPRLVRWTADHADALRQVRPAMPEELGDREQDCWEPLFAIADVIAGEWPARARSAAIRLLGERDEEDVAGIMLLTDIRAAFKKNHTDRLTTKSILHELTEMEERPWLTWSRGRALSSRQLARLLKPFGIKPGTIRVSDNSTPKGYMRDWFQDTWDRYLDNPEGSSATDATNATSASDPDLQTESAWRVAESCATADDRGGGVADGDGSKALHTNGVARVADEPGGFRDLLGDDLADKLGDLLDEREACYRAGALDIEKHGTADELRRYVDEILADDREEDARDLVRLHYDAAVRGEFLPIEGERP